MVDFALRIISRQRLKEFWSRNAGTSRAEGPLRAWYSEVKAADWSSPADVRKRFASASVLKSGRVVFNLGGNRFRLVAAINYAHRIVYVRFVGTHAEYDAIDAESV